MEHPAPNPKPPISSTPSGQELPHWFAGFSRVGLTCACVPVRDEKAWNNWLFVLAGSQLIQVRDQIGECPEQSRNGYERELEDQQVAMMQHKTFSGYLEALRMQSQGILSAKLIPLDFGRSLARKRIYSACVAIQYAATMPREIEPSWPG